MNIRSCLQNGSTTFKDDDTFAESFGIDGKGMRTTDVVLPQVLASKLAIHLERQQKCLFSLLAGYLLKKGKVTVLFRLFLLESKKNS